MTQTSKHTPGPWLLFPRMLRLSSRSQSPRPRRPRMPDPTMSPYQERAIASARQEVASLAKNPKGDTGLKLALLLAHDDLEWIEDYFDHRLDCDGDSEGQYPNEEMRRLSDVRRVRETLRRIVEALP